MAANSVGMLLVAWAGTFSCLVTQVSAQMREVHVNAGKVTGTIRSFQGVNRVPFQPNGPDAPDVRKRYKDLLGLDPVLSQWYRPNLPDLRKQFRDIAINSVRTHDTAGPTDIDAFRKGHPQEGIIFPNWDADPEKPESYIFGPSDPIITGITETGAEVYFRIGRTFNSDPILPPDFDKYANVVKHIAMHYNDGWAAGFHYNIRHWEFWNEPDVTSDWIRNDNDPGDTYFINWPAPTRQFYYLYEKVARSLKSYDPKLKVGCCALSRGQSSSPYREGLIRFCAERKVPLDFYSWHHYTYDSPDPWDYVRIGRQVREILNSNGFYNAENYCTEWDLSPAPGRPGRQSMDAAAWRATTLMYMQDAPIEIAHFETGPSLFGRDGAYTKTAYVFKATSAMLRNPERLAVTGADTIGFAVLAGRSQDAKTVQILIGNYEIPDLVNGAARPSLRALRPPNVPILEPRRGIDYKDNRGYSITVSDLPWAQSEFSVKRYRITDKENLDLVGETSGKGGAFTLSNPLPPPAVELIVLERR